MNRRAVLKLLAAAALAGCKQPKSGSSDLHVVVAGAGIVGASIAYHLAKSGASVTVIDKQGPATHASRGTFAWINATWAKQPHNYHALSQEGVSNWKELHQTLGFPVRWSGSIEWFDDATRQAKLVEQISEQIEWGEDARMLRSAELARIEPNIDFAGTQQAALSGNDGAVDPVLATHALLKAAEDMGAVVQYPCELTDVLLSAGRLAEVHTDTGTIKADRLVLATGAAADAGIRFAQSDIPQRSTPGVITITAAMPPILNHIISAPGIHMHQRTDGRIVLGEQDGAPQNEAHALRLEGRPNSFPDEMIAGQHADRMLSVAKRFAPGIERATVEDVYIGWRPLPIDGHPVLGRSPARPDVYLAVMHSGVTLAPIVGQIAANELIGNVTADRLAEFRPGRSFEIVKRY